MVTNSVSPPLPPPLPNWTHAGHRAMDCSPRYGVWELDELKQETKEWIQRADQAGADIAKQVNKLRAIVQDAAPLYHAETGAPLEVVINQQIFFHDFYCNKIIQKLFLQEVLQREEAALKDPTLQDVQDLVKSCAKFARKQIDLHPPVAFQSPKTTAEQCKIMWDKVEEMTDKVKQTAQHKAKTRARATHSSR